MPTASSSDIRFEARFVAPAGVIALLIGWLGGASSVGAFIFLLFLGIAAAQVASVVASKGTSTVTGSRALAACVLALFLLVPVTVDISSSALFTVPKLTVVLIGAAAILAILASQSFSVRRAPLWRNGLHIPVLLFLLWAAVSTWFSINPRVGILGDYDSYDGLLLLLAEVVIFFGIVEAFTINDLRRVMSVLFVAATGVVVLHGILQLLDGFFPSPGWDFLDLGGSGGLFATLLNRNHFAGWLVTALPMGLALGVSSRMSGDRLLVGGLAVLLLGELIVTGSAGGVAAALAGGVCYGALDRRRISAAAPIQARRTLVAATVLLVLSVGAIAVVKMSPVVRGALINPAAAGGGRLEFWRVAGEMAMERPLTGIGPDNYRALFPKYQSEGYVEAYGPNQAVNGPHNIFMSHLASLGFPGLLFFVTVCVFGLARAIATMHRLRASGDRTSIPVAAQDAHTMVAGLTGSLVAYLVQASFNVQSIPLSFLFWCTLGLLTSAALDAGVPPSLSLRRIFRGATEGARKEAKPNKKRGRESNLPIFSGRRVSTPSSPPSARRVPVSGLVVAGVLVPFALTAGWVGSRPHRADRLYRSARGVEAAAERSAAEAATRQREIAYAGFSEAAHLNPWEPRYADRAAQMRLRFPIDLVTVRPASPETTEGALAQVEAALGWLDRAVRAEPEAPDLRATRAEVLLLQSELAKDNAPAQRAIVDLRKAVAINRWDPRYAGVLAQALLDLERREEAGAVVADALRRAPDDPMLVDLSKRL